MRRKNAELDGAANLHRGKKDNDRCGHRKGQQKIQARGRQRHQHHKNDADRGERQQIVAQLMQDRDRTKRTSR
jgi:hypothetical protein